MTISNKLILGLNKLITNAGIPIRIRYYNSIFDEVYDEATTLSLSGTLWTSGIVMPLATFRGTSEAVLLEQGQITESDQKLFVSGNVSFTGSNLLIDIQLGSPNGQLYSVISPGL